MEEKTQDILEYDLNIKGVVLHVCRDSSGEHTITFVDSKFKSILETEDEWVYHEDNESNLEEFFNISLKKENGMFSYSNESRSGRFLERYELGSTHLFIQKIVKLIEEVKVAIEEEEKTRGNNQSTKNQRIHDDDDERDL